jgi:hypothetical protein
MTYIHYYTTLKVCRYCAGSIAASRFIEDLRNNLFYFKSARDCDISTLRLAECCCSYEDRAVLMLKFFVAFEFKFNHRVLAGNRLHRFSSAFFGWL